MPRMITEQTFYRFVKCPSWVYFDAHTPGKPHDPLKVKLLEDGLISEKEREVISDRPDIAEVTAEDPEEAFKQTLAFMREGRETIYQGVLVHGHWVGNPDVLAKVEGKSNFGNYYYVAADIKRARELRDEHRFQGCFYAELLERVQGIKPVQGYILTPDKTLLPYLIESFEIAFRLNLDEIEQIVAGKKPAHFLSSSCKQSPWFSECKLESQGCDDLSSLNRVWKEEVDALRDIGIETVAALAAASPAELERRAPDLRPGRLQILQTQAKAMQSGMHTVIGRVDLPESETELFIDVESDPMRDVDFLIGVLEVRGGKETYHAFLAETPEQEGKMWKEFTDFITGYFDVPMYQYGWYEFEVMRLLGTKYGVSDFVREALENNMIDLLNVLRPAIAFPLPFYSLKDLCAYIGFSWRHAEASGVNAVLWYEDWLKTKDRRKLQDIVEYNEDDVRATRALKQWVAEHAGPYQI